MSEPNTSTGRHTVSSSAHPGVAVTLEWAAATDTGRVRENNQDSYIAAPPIFAVADGMGGHSGGEVASQAVVARLASIAGAGFVVPGSIDDALASAVSDIEATAASGTEADIDVGTGTTVTGVAVDLVECRPTWLVFNIGDSRVYRLEGDVFAQVTVDHSVVQELVEAGKITREEAVRHPYGNVITRAVGFNEVPHPDYTNMPIVRGTRLLICSDGLSKELTDHGIRHYLEGASSVEEAATALIGAALDNGGRDNVSVVIVDVLDVTSGTGGAPTG